MLRISNFSKMFDLISIGDTVIDTFIPLQDVEVEEKDGGLKLILPFGMKVRVGDSSSMVGGNAANSVVGASRLGLKTAIYTNVGKKDDDEADERIVNKFEKEKVDTRYVVHNSNFSTSHNFILNFKGERTILIHHHEWKYDLPDLDSAKWVYLTSLAPNYVNTNIVDQVLNYLERTKAKLVYQPGTFQIKLSLKKNARILSLAEVLITNLEEAKLLLGMDVDQKKEVKKLLKDLSNNGPKKIVITDGGEGSYAFDGEKYFKLDVFPAKVIQKTGAGDAYSSGLLAGLFYGKELQEAMRWGSANSAGVVEKIGPQAGLLNYSEMLEKLKVYKNIVAKEM